MNTQGDVVVIGGVGVNAFTIARTLRRVGWRGDVLFLRFNYSSADFVPAVLGEGQVIQVTQQAPEHLIEYLGEMARGRRGRLFLFLTDERLLPAVDAYSCSGRKEIRCYYGASRFLPYILDRLSFAQFISERNLAPVPRTIDGLSDPFSVFGDDFVVRPRRSWRGLHARESVQLVSGREDFESKVSYFRSKGIERAELSYQEKLSVRDIDNISVCGWFDSEDPLLHCTRKVRQHPPSIGDGDVVETIPFPEGVREAAVGVLRSLEYEGPFELEFVKDTHADEYKIIELNPRFWLQHGLVEALSSYQLVQRYIGNRAVHKSGIKMKRYWFNTLHVFQRIARLDLYVLKLALSGRVVWAYGFREAIMFLLALTRRRFGVGNES